MKYTISERTITVETTQPGEALNKDTVKALTHRETAWETVERLALAAPAVETEIDKTPDPLEGLSYADIDPTVLLSENFTPANILSAE